MTTSKPINMEMLHKRVKQRALADEIHSSIVSNECIHHAIMYAIKIMQLEGTKRQTKKDPIFRIDYNTVKGKVVGFTENPELTSLDIILTPFGIPNRIYTINERSIRTDIEYELMDIDLIVDIEYLRLLMPTIVNHKNSNILRFSANYDISKIIDGGSSVTENPRNIPTITTYNKINVPLITEYEEEYIVVHASERIASDFRLSLPTNNNQDKERVTMLLRSERKRLDENKPISTILI